MDTALGRQTASRLLSRHYVEFSTALAVLFVLHTGLIPFDFFAGRGKGGAGAFFGAGRAQFTIPDVISNLMLYLPVGILVQWSLFRALRRTVLATVLTLGAVAGLSGGIEWLQAYSPTRVSSLIDLASNVAGASFGIALVPFIRRIVPRFVGAAYDEVRQRPETIIVKAYVAMLVLAAAMPFSFSFDVGLMERSFHSATWVPFGAFAAGETAQESAWAAGDSRAYELHQWQVMKCWSRWAAEAVSFAVLAGLAYPVLSRFYGFRPAATIALIFWTCGGLAVGLSLVHLFMVTRSFDVTDILVRWFGIAAGLLVRSLCVRAAGASPAQSGERRWRLAASLACAGVLAYTVYINVIPLTFSSYGNGRGGAAVVEWLPFSAYFRTRFDFMMDDMMEKLTVYILLSALLITCSRRLQALSVRARAATTALVGVTVSVSLEAVQAFIPIRVTSVTDPILAGFGCAAGAVVQEHLRRIYRFMLSIAESDAPTDEARVPALSPTDALIGTLMDETADAPVEPSVPTKVTPQTEATRSRHPGPDSA